MKKSDRGSSVFNRWRLLLRLRLTLPDVSSTNDAMDVTSSASTIRDCVFLAVSAAGVYPIIGRMSVPRLALLLPISGDGGGTVLSSWL